MKTVDTKDIIGLILLVKFVNKNAAKNNVFSHTTFL